MGPDGQVILELPNSHKVSFRTSCDLNGCGNGLLTALPEFIERGRGSEHICKGYELLTRCIIDYKKEVDMLIGT